MTQTEHCGRTSDAELVARFARFQCEAAFEELVRRHCPLVWGVCKRILKNDQDAEDALQATFLVLARNAASIRRRQSIASWLYGVAYRTSLKAAAGRSRRGEVTRGDLSMAVDRSLADVTTYHDQRLLDEELNRLPEKYRAALVMHYLEGKSLREIAAELALTRTAVKGRLQRGRDRLRMRLAVRGVGLSLVLLAVEASRRSLEAAQLEPLISATVNQFASNNPGQLNPLVRELAGKETSLMPSSSSMLIAVAMLSLVLGGLAWHASDKHVMAQSHLATSTAAEVKSTATGNREASPSFLAAVQPNNQATGATSRATVLKYGDGEPDGKKSLGGSGQMIRFQLPDAKSKVRGIRIHGARYGYPQRPKEDVLIYFLDSDGEEILHTQQAPYSLFDRGETKWNTVRFRRPLEVTETFWVVLDFKAERTKGVYVSYDNSTDGANSLAGLPGKEARETGFEGDWMIQALLTD